MRTEQVKFEQEIPALTGYILSEEVPFNGHIKSILIHFPLGCNGLVDVSVEYDQHHICPREGYVNLNDATPLFEVDIEVEKGKPLEVEFRNADDTYSHSPKVLVALEEK